MEKIVFTNIPMTKKLHALKYSIDGNSEIDYDGKVVFPINAVLAKTLKKDETVTVVLLKKLDVEGNSDINVGEFMKELNSINGRIGASIDYKIIDTPFEEDKDTHETLLRRMIDTIKDNSVIYADMTYGPKSLPIVLFSVLNFAEKFLNCNIKNIVYGKVNFVSNEKGESLPSNPVLCDMTPLYYLNSVTNSMECKNGEEDRKMLDNLLSF